MSVRSALALCLALAAPAWSQAAPPAGEVPVVPAGDMTVTRLAETWTRVTGIPVSVDPHCNPIVIHFSVETRLERPVLRTVLGLCDVVVIEDERGGLQLHHRRNVAQQAPTASPVITGQAPEGDALITWVHYVRHGGGEGIFASLRGLMARDTNRIGNCLWVADSRALVIADLAPQVRYYQAVVAKLDVARPLTALALRVLELPRARWTALAAGARGAELARALGQEADAVELEAASLDLAGEAFSLQRQHQLADGIRQVRVQVGPATAPEGAPARGDDALRLALEVMIHAGNEHLSRQLTVALPSLFGEPATLVQAFAGRGGEHPTQLVLILDVRPHE